MNSAKFVVFNWCRDFTALSFLTDDFICCITHLMKDERKMAKSAGYAFPMLLLLIGSYMSRFKRVCVRACVRACVRGCACFFCVFVIVVSVSEFVRVYLRM